MSLIWSQKPITDEDDPYPIHTVGLEVEREPEAAPASWKKGSVADSGASHRRNALGDRTPV
jgi:hypothetical protein